MEAVFKEVTLDDKTRLQKRGLIGGGTGLRVLFFFFFFDLCLRVFDA